MTSEQSRVEAFCDEAMSPRPGTSGLRRRQSDNADALAFLKMAEANLGGSCLRRHGFVGAHVDAVLGSGAAEAIGLVLRELAGGDELRRTDGR